MFGIDLSGSLEGYAENEPLEFMDSGELIETINGEEHTFQKDFHDVIDERATDLAIHHLNTVSDGLESLVELRNILRRSGDASSTMDTTHANLLRANLARNDVIFGTTTLSSGLEDYNSNMTYAEGLESIGGTIKKLVVALRNFISKVIAMAKDFFTGTHRLFKRMGDRAKALLDQVEKLPADHPLKTASGVSVDLGDNYIATRATNKLLGLNLEDTVKFYEGDTLEKILTTGDKLLADFTSSLDKVTDGGESLNDDVRSMTKAVEEIFTKFGDRNVKVQDRITGDAAINGDQSKGYGVTTIEGDKFKIAGHTQAAVLKLPANYLMASINDTMAGYVLRSGTFESEEVLKFDALAAKPMESILKGMIKSCERMGKLSNTPYVSRLESKLGSVLDDLTKGDTVEGMDGSVKRDLDMIKRMSVGLVKGKQEVIKAWLQSADVTNKLIAASLSSFDESGAVKARVKKEESGDDNDKAEDPKE